MALHVFFCPSAAGSFRQALRRKRIDQPVVDLTDVLSWGPIACGFAGRQRWLNEHVPVDWGEWDWIGENDQRIAEAHAIHPDRQLWLSASSASDLCGLHWYLDRFGSGGTAIHLIDQLQYPGRWDGPLLSLGTINADQFGWLLDHVEAQPWDPQRFPVERWAELLRDDALLRVIEDGRVTSVAADWFDNQLLRHCSGEWRRAYRVIADAMGSIWDDGRHMDVAFLAWRLRTLADSGVIESNRPIILHAREEPAFVRLCERK